jgi:hypothetical protein
MRLLVYGVVGQIAGSTFHVLVIIAKYNRAGNSHQNALAAIESLCSGYAVAEINL